MRISDWSSDVCSSDLVTGEGHRVDRLHADDVVAGVDVMDLAGDARGQVGHQVQPGAADILEGDVAAQRRVVLVPLQDVAEVADAGGGQRLHRPRSEERRVGKVCVSTFMSRWWPFL